MMRTRRTRWLSLALIVALAIAAAQMLGEMLIVSSPVDNPDAIVSLASHEWERLPVAARLAGRYPRARVLLTEPRRVTVDNCHDCGRRTARLANLGIDPRRVTVLWLTEDDTYGEASATAAFVARSGIRRLMIVTSPYHTRRALATFQHVLPRTAAIGVAPAFPESPARPRTWWGHPYDRWYVAYEVAALVEYAGRHHVFPVGLRAKMR